MEEITMITDLIRELVIYGKKNGLICEADEVYATNRLLELFDVMEYEENPEITEPRAVCEILEDMMEYAHENGIMKEDTITAKDLFDTKIMGCITPPPSVVRAEFAKRYAESPKEATDYYYQFSQATNYIRKDRIAKDEKWVTDTEYGPIDITINLSKPEKDPRDIAKAGQAKKSGYPACLLCKENEGYAGHFSHPARQNHRVIPIKLDGQNYYLQYSPYVYYNEHCIIFNEQHIPMKIDYAVFRKLLDFVRQYPHYMAGSNADLPIVGGSILSHDHFQGGGYVFAMAKADYERLLKVNPASYNGRLGLATLEQKEGKHEDALRILNNMFAAKGKDAQLSPSQYAMLYVARAGVEKDLKHMDMALVDLEEAIRLDSSQPDIYLMRGEIYLVQKKKDLAKRDFEKAISLGVPQSDLRDLLKQTRK